MKKLLLAALTLCTVTFTSPVSYSNLRSNFKENMYKKQSGLMDYKTYMQFLEEHLIIGEKILVIPRTALALKLADACELEPYFDLLTKINTTMFFHLVKPSKRTTESLQNKKQLLLTIIQDIKTKWDMTNLEPESEVQNTINFFDNSTQDYYSKLSYFARLKVKALATVSKVRGQ